MLCDFVPRCVSSVLLAGRRRADEARAVADLAEDQQALRDELERRHLVAFVADGAVLPRASGVSSKPMGDARPFRSPESLRVTVDLPHRGPTSGMAIARGVTLIVGGGYHGKSTLLKAVEAGRVQPRGRRRARVRGHRRHGHEAARRRRPYRAQRRHLPLHRRPAQQGRHHATSRPSTPAAAPPRPPRPSRPSRPGARTFLIDEDTSATNFMVRDALMQAVVGRDHEPITPFVERVREPLRAGGRLDGVGGR